MAYEIKIEDKIRTIEILSREGNYYQIAIDNKVYELDILEVEQGIYSVLHENRSFNVELVENRGSKSYFANTFFSSFEVEIIDAEAKYMLNRRSAEADESNVIVSPMPGKVVKVLFKEGDAVKAGQTVVVVSAMKMDSEYKVKQDRIIKRILVKEGDTVSSEQPMVILE